MDVSNEDSMQAILGVMRGQAWSRAKGELDALLSAFASRGDEEVRSRFDRLYRLIAEFSKTVEDEGLAE
jgi:hypothetical protein